MPADAIVAFAVELRAALHDSTRVVFGGGAIDPSALAAVAGVSWAASIADVTGG
jgi:hypothetical protein